MTVTLMQARRNLLKACPELGKTHTLTALATGSITVGALANTNLPTNRFDNVIAYRGEATTAADYRRYLDVLTASTGLITHTGANYSDTTVTNEEVEFWYDPEIVPDIDVNQCYADALEQLRVLCRVPLAHGPIDYDMQASGITNWTANAGTPFSKQTTQAEVGLGARSGLLTDAGSGGDYTQSALGALSAGARGTMYFIAKADTGTGRFLTLNATGTVVATVDTTAEDWVLGWKECSFDSADEQWRLRVQAVAASDSVDVAAFWFVKNSDYYFNLSRFPGWITSAHHVVGMSVANPQQAAGDSAYSFGSVEYMDLQEGVDFYFQRNHGDASPTGVFILKQHWMGRPLFLNVSCPWSEPYGVARAFSAETDTTECNTDLLNAQVKLLMGERWPAKLGYLSERGKREKMTLLGQFAMPPKTPVRSGWLRGAYS